MKSFLKYLVVASALLVILIGVMWAGGICPPQGPWPSPPWCSAAKNSVVYDGSPCPPPGPWKMPPWCVKVEKFNPDFPAYLETLPAPAGRNLTFGIATTDYWGNPHIWVNLGEDSREHVDSTAKRISEIGASMYAFTDVLSIGKGGKVFFTNESTMPNCYTIQETELSGLVSKVRENSIHHTMLMVNLAGTDSLINYINDANKTGNKREYEIGMKMAKQMEDNGIDVVNCQDVMKNLSSDGWDMLFENWKSGIIKEAEKAEKAGVDYIVISPGDCRPEFYNKTYTYQSRKYMEIAGEVRNHFHGKVGIWGDFGFLTGINLTPYDFVLVLFDAKSIPEVKEAFSGVDDNSYSSIQEAWKQYLSRPEFEKLAQGGKEVYLFLIIPSYDGATRKGWIEPGALYGEEYQPDFKEQAMNYDAMFREIYELNPPLAGIISYGYHWDDRIYPDSPNLRTDLSHSIRMKDAENVFYGWSRIFK